MPPARAWFGVGCHGPQRPALRSEPPGHGSNGERGAPTCDGWPRASALPCAGRRRAAACGARPAAGSRSRCEPQPSHLTASFRVHERHGNTCKPPAGPVGWRSICARTAQRTAPALPGPCIKPHRQHGKGQRPAAGGLPSRQTLFKYHCAAVHPPEQRHGFQGVMGRGRMTGSRLAADGRRRARCRRHQMCHLQPLQATHSVSHALHTPATFLERPQRRPRALHRGESPRPHQWRCFYRFPRSLTACRHRLRPAWAAAVWL